MKKVDMFKADRQMAVRVAEYMRTKVWGITLKTRLKKELASYEEQLKIIADPEQRVMTAEEAEGFRRRVEARAKFAKEKFDAQMKEEARFELTDADKAFYAAYKGADTDDKIKQAIVAWAKVYDLDLTGTDLLAELFRAISGARKLGASAIIRSEATKFTDDKRTKNDVLSILYGRMAEKMLEAGTLKPQAIPEDIREYYAPKSRKNK